MTARKLGDLTPFHHLRIVEKVCSKSVGSESAPEETGIVVTNVYLDDKELHGPIENELRVVYGPEQLTVAYVPVVVASITVEREVVDNEPEGKISGDNEERA